ncbi:MAG: MFS transporter [Nannocystaceae bacterium]
MKKLALLGDPKFWPLFWTQFFGAFNDNLFKNALVILVAYRSMSVAGLGSGQVVVLSAGVFILPFFLFSASAGQLADKIPKHRLMSWVKIAEIPIMGLAAAGFYFDAIEILLAVLFLMGLQSAVFGPAKYSVLPEILEEKELVAGNALVEMGTFVAILLGTIGGGALIAMGETGPAWISAAVVAVAVTGWLCSRKLVPTPAGDPRLRFDFNPIRPTWRTFQVARKNRPVYLSILGISWFWFFGAAFLSLLPTYCKDVLQGNEHAVTFYLSLFCVGIAAGSMLCERFSGRHLELGLVPLGSIGMTVFAADLFFVGTPSPEVLGPSVMLPFGDFISAPGRLRIGVDLALVAVFGGLYTVPLYTMIQQRSPASIRARIIAANNIINACFMVVSSLLIMAGLAAGLTLPELFLGLAVLNAVVAFYIYTIIPEFLLRFVVWMLTHLIYRVRVEGGEHLPLRGAGVIVANHVSFVDWMFIASVSPRPVRFVMHHGFMSIPLLRMFFRDAKIIPIAAAYEDAGLLGVAFDSIARELDAGELVCIFPEGKLTRDGRMNAFRGGIEKILQRSAVPVIPVGIAGLWGSWFSRWPDGRARPRLGKLGARIKLRIGQPLPPRTPPVRADDLERIVGELAGQGDNSTAERRHSGT